jgi:hypothetical protein
MEIINLKNAIDLDFQKIISNKSKCDEYISQIQELIEKINTKYNLLISNIKDNNNIEIPIYLGIDSLNFQNKLYLLKFENIKKFYNRVFNRIYGDYYKIHKLIKKYITTNTTISPIDITFTQYKDLETDKCYNFDEVIKIQNTINQYIQSLYDIINKKNITIEPFINSNNAGYAVKYYISEENTNINIYTNKCLLFINYLTTFNTYHNNYLLDFLQQCKFLITSIKKDVNFNIDNELIDIDNYINDTDISNITLNYITRNSSFSSANTDNTTDDYTLTDISNATSHIIIYSTIDEKLSIDISNTSVIKDNIDEKSNTIDEKSNTIDEKSNTIDISDSVVINEKNSNIINKINYCNPNKLSLDIKEISSKEENKHGFCTIL